MGSKTNGIIDKRVLLLHNSPSKYLIESLLSANLHVVVAGNFQSTVAYDRVTNIEVDVFNIPFLIDVIREYNKNQPIDCVLPVWEGSIIATTLLANALGLKSNPLSAVKQSRDKLLAALAYKSFNIPAPKFWAINFSDTYQDFFSSEIKFPLIAKLPSSTNSQSVMLVHNLVELKSALKRLENLYTLDEKNGNRLYSLYGADNKKILLQEYVEGIELNIDLIYLNGNFIVCGIFEKAPMCGPYFAEMQSIYPTTLSEAQLAECVRLAENSVKALGGILGAAHVELRYTEKGPVIIETALRPGGFYTALAIESLTGFCIYHFLVAILVCEQMPLRVEFPRTRACLYGAVNIGKKGRISSISGTDIFKKIENIIDYNVLKKVGDYTIPLPEGSDYHIAQFMLSGTNPDELKMIAEKIRSSLSVEIDEVVL